MCIRERRMRLRSVPPPAMWKDAQGAWWTSAEPHPWLALPRQLKATARRTSPGTDPSHRGLRCTGLGNLFPSCTRDVLVSQQTLIKTNVHKGGGSTLF